MLHSDLTLCIPMLVEVSNKATAASETLATLITSGDTIIASGGWHP